jgi:uncharacterized membrane protein (DUF2068 family)
VDLHPGANKNSRPQGAQPLVCRSAAPAAREGLRAPPGKMTYTEFVKKRAPTLYVIIAIKLLKGSLFIALAVLAYTLSDNNLSEELHRVLQILRLNPERKFFSDLATQLGTLTQANVLWTAAGTFIYSLFSLVEGIGLMFRVSWAGWMAIGESAFFIPIEVYELSHKFRWGVLGILALNILIVWYLAENRHRLFKHHHHHN